MTKLTEFISGFLGMELSAEKTLITHSSESARFVGYDIRVRRDGTVKRGGVKGLRTKSWTPKFDVSRRFCP